MIDRKDYFEITFKMHVSAFRRTANELTCSQRRDCMSLFGKQAYLIHLQIIDGSSCKLFTL